MYEGAAEETTTNPSHSSTKQIKRNFQFDLLIHEMKK